MKTYLTAGGAIAAALVVPAGASAGILKELDPADRVERDVARRTRDAQEGTRWRPREAHPQGPRGPRDALPT